MEQKKKIKVIIIVLAILLGLSLLALGGTLIYNKIANATPATVTVPDNLITTDEDTTKPDSSDSQAPDSSDTEKPDGSYTQTPDSSAAASSSAVPAQSITAEVKKAATIELYNKQPEENTPFQVENMFPGDSETKYYCVRVSHKGDVILRLHANVRPGYEKLSEVLCCRVLLPENGEVLYDGLMRDMPASLSHALRTSISTTSEVYYEITAYLDTSVGNEYMDKDLIADFRWWVEETGNLDSPQTGDPFHLYLWLCIASGSLLLLILLWRKRKKEDAANER